MNRNLLMWIFGRFILNTLFSLIFWSFLTLGALTGVIHWVGNLLNGG